MHFPGAPLSVTGPADARTARIGHPGELAGALRDLGLGQPRPVLVVVGGAGGLSSRELGRVRPLFADALGPAVRAVEGAVVDGGTDSGVMRLMGEVAAAGPAFPLVGVAAAGTITRPGTSEDEATAPFEPHHTHLLLVPGHRWGDESPWISLVASALAGPRPSVTVLVNGGDVAWSDAEASVGAGRPVIVVDGSGRAADDIAAVLRGAGDPARGPRLEGSGLVEVVPLDAGADELAQVVRARLGGSP